MIRLNQNLNSLLTDYQKKYSQIVVVAKSGGDYTTVQGALDSITDATSTKKYAVLVAPGRYNEQITPVEYVSVIGLGQGEDCEIYFDGKVVDITTQLETCWRDIYFNCPATGDNLDVIEIDAGEHEFFHCKIEWQTTTDAIRGKLFDLNGGTIEMEHCTGRYTATGSGAAALHVLIDMDGSVEYKIIDCDFLASVASSSGGRVIEDASTTTGNCLIRNTKFEINCTHATFGSSMFMLHIEGTAVTREFKGNTFHIHNTGGGAAGTGTVIWQNGSGSGVLDSIDNIITVTGMGSNRSLQNDASDIINSYNDTIDADNTNLSGTLNIDSAEKTAGRLVSSNVVLSNVKGKGMQLVPDSPVFGWRDILGEIKLHGVGANEPAYNIYRDGIRSYEFNTDGDEVFIEFHIPHDYLPGSDIFIHCHWSHHNASTITTGILTWTFETTYAKGHNQEAFGSTVSPTVAHNAASTSVIQYQHMITEVQLSAGSPSGTQIDSDDIEVDGLILMRVEKTSNTMADDPFLHFCDVHYQSTNVGTKEKAPDFWT